MESLPYGLPKKNKNKKKKQDKDDTNKTNEINEIIVITSTLMIKSIMEKNGYFPKSDYFIKNKTEDIFPENCVFEKPS